MDLTPAETVEIRTMTSKAVGSSSFSSPGSGSSNHPPALMKMEDYDQHVLVKDDSIKLRRPVRPVDRQRMRPWLMELLDVGNVYGLNWTNRHQGVFQISWRHASRLGWNLETDGDVFERWARHTGIYKEGDPPEPKRWKANFRCALHSLQDVVELTTAVERRGSDACRTYRFLHNHVEISGTKKRKPAKQRPKEVYYGNIRVEEAIPELPESQQAPVYEFVTTEIVSNDDLNLISETESEEEAKQERVIVQKLEPKSQDSEEEHSLQHDHDYLALQKGQKTIVLRQGIGSIVLHKEVLGAPKDKGGDSGSNLEELASAAVSSAGWNTILAPGLATSSGDAKALKAKIKSKLATKEMLQEDQRAAYNLKYLLTGNHEDAGEPSASALLRASRKRKADSLSDHHHASISVGAEETVGTETSTEQETGEMYPFVAQKVTKSPRRTASPRILSGAKARRQRSKSEKTDSDSTEPLMSSCLLLLEAATRLDNAEKDEIISDVRARGKGRSASARTTAVSAAVRAKKLVKAEPASSDDESESSAIGQSEESLLISSDQDLHMVLRKTLESLKNRKAKPNEQEVEPTITFDISDGNILQSTDSGGNIVVVTEADDAKGLFSGSSIQTSAGTVITQAGQRGKSKGKTDSVFIDQDGTTVEMRLVGDGGESGLVQGEDGETQYVEMVMQGDEEGVAYIQANSVPGEIVIENVGGDQEVQGEYEQDGSTIRLQIPPGSVLLQTSDGTPIGILDNQGKITAFDSSDEEALSLIAAKLAESTEVAGLVDEEGKAVAQSEVIVKLEPGEEQTSSSGSNNDNAAVKVEPVNPEEFVDAQDDLAGTDFEVELVGSEIYISQENVTPFLVQSLLSDLTPPYTLEDIVNNFKKGLVLHRSKQSICSTTTQEDGTVSNTCVKRLDYMCKSMLIRMCVSVLLESNQCEPVIPSPLAVASKPSKTIRTLPMGQQEEIVSEEMDPTAPLSIGEIPLFASAKGDSDSMSPPSD